MKYYAVKTGRILGIYETWEECKSQVNGFSGAEYKSFRTYSEAAEFIGNGNDDVPVALEGKNTESHETTSEVVAYTDGSYDPGSKIFSYGVIIIRRKKITKFSMAFKDYEKAKMRNVAGEIEGAKKVIEYCLNNNIKSVDIYYDYEGIEKWCTGEWKVTKLETREYREYYLKAAKKIKIHFVKVKSHSGNRYNDMVDTLAKNAIKDLYFQ